MEVNNTGKTWWDGAKIGYKKLFNEEERVTYEFMNKLTIPTNLILSACSCFRIQGCFTVAAKIDTSYLPERPCHVRHLQQ